MGKISAICITLLQLGVLIGTSAAEGNLNLIGHLNPGYHLFVNCEGYTLDMFPPGEEPRAIVKFEDDQCIVHSTPKEALIMMNGDRYDESRSTSVTEPIHSILTLVHIYSYGKGYAIYDL